MAGTPGPVARRFTLGLCAFSLFSALVVPGVLAAVSPQNPIYTTLRHSKRFLRGLAFDDSWRPMRLSLEHFHANPGTSLYQLFFEDNVKFIYPPTSLLPLEALSRMPIDEPISDVFLNRLSQFATATALLLSVGLFMASLRRAFPGERGALDTTLRTGAALLLGLTFYPLTRAFTLGQAQTWIDAFVALALVGWFGGMRAPPGVAVGLACAIKPQLGLLLPWALLRREWRFSGAMTATLLALGLTSLALYGIESHLDYLRLLGFLSRHGEAFHGNQSMNGLLHRLLGVGADANWDARVYPPFHLGVYLGTIVTSVALLGLGLLWRRQEHARAGATDLSVAILACTMAAPIVWEHHYGVLLPIFGWAVPVARRLAERLPWGLAGFALGWLLLAEMVQDADLLTSTRWHVLQSFELFGALFLLALLMRLRRIEASSGAGTAQRAA